jgi:uncharacterized protein DUF4189
MKMSHLRALMLAAAMAAAPVGPAFATGAIAVDDQPGQKPSDAGYGIGFGDSKESAQKAALAKCNTAGNTSCKVVVWFEKCGAYASSNEKYGIGWAATEDDAKSKALDQCGNGQCRLVASDCGD